MLHPSTWVPAAALLFAAAAFVAAMGSAWLWYLSSKVQIIPLWEKLGQIEPIGGSDTHWTLGILEAATKGAALNRNAALWTAAAAILGACSTLLNALPR